jgi:hypothetical protein
MLDAVLMEEQRKAIHCNSCNSDFTFRHTAFLDSDFQAYAWGEYHNANWRTVFHFCEECFEHRVLAKLTDHVLDCGCNVTFCSRSGHSLPSFIRQHQENINVVSSRRPLVVSR